MDQDTDRPHFVRISTSGDDDMVLIVNHVFWYCQLFFQGTETAYWKMLTLLITSLMFSINSTVCYGETGL